MVVLRGVKKGLGVWIRKKLGRAGAPDPRDIYGIYQVRTRFNRRTQVKEVFYTPTNPQTIPQQTNRQKFTNIVAEWQGLTEEQKSYYNELKAPTGMSGYNRYLHHCMLDSSWPHCPMASFLSLLDTPASYSGQAGKYVLVNAGEDALEFGEIAAANKALSNLENVAVNISIIPNIDSAIALGSSSKAWNNVYSDNYYANTRINLPATASTSSGGPYLYFTVPTRPTWSIWQRYSQLIFSEGAKNRTNSIFQFDTTTIMIGRHAAMNRLEPYIDSRIDLGFVTRYFLKLYIDKIYLNSTAILDGATAGHLKFTGDLVPATDDTEWIGEIGSPFKAIKGLVIKDTTDGKHYKVEVVNGVLTTTALD